MYLFSFRALTSIPFPFLRELRNQFSLANFVPDSLIFYFNNTIRVFFVCIVEVFSVCVRVFVWHCVQHISTHMTSSPCLSALQRLQLSCMTEHTQSSCPSNQNTPISDPHVCYLCLSPTRLHKHRHTLTNTHT